ncbi:MAG: PQQ-binding-like beta-propeller repeat protein [Firmicutes bacterium]|nr:PQQ-binding-like beta-propeller repeat protein [Bacillota bacterium]
MKKNIAKNRLIFTVIFTIFTIFTIFALFAVSGCKPAGQDNESARTLSPEPSGITSMQPSPVLSPAAQVSSEPELIMMNSACPKFRNDNSNSGRSTGACPENPEILWTFKTGGSIARPPSLDNKGNIYFGGNDSVFYCVNPNGKLLWKTKLDEWVDSTPVITGNGIVIVGCDDGNLIAISPEGKILWKYYLHAEISSSPSITSNLVFTGSEDGSLYGINANGEVKSKFKAKSRILVSSPAITEDGNIIAGAEDSNLYCIKPDGSVVWQYKGECEEVFVSPPAITPDGSIVFGTPEKKMVCLEKTGRLKWEIPLHEETSVPAGIGKDGKIYAVANDGVLMSVDPNGKILWKTKAPEREITGGLCLSSNDRIIMSGTKIHIYDISGKLLKVVSSLKGKLTEPVLGADGKIFAGSSSGFLYCLGKK